MSRNKILDRRAALEAALYTVNYRIKNLKKLYARAQVRCWYILRNDIARQLKNLPTPEQVKQDAKLNTAARKSIIQQSGPKWSDSLQNKRFHK